jgi:hypothetical protein
VDEEIIPTREEYEAKRKKILRLKAAAPGAGFCLEMPAEAYEDLRARMYANGPDSVITPVSGLHDLLFIIPNTKPVLRRQPRFVKDVSEWRHLTDLYVAGKFKEIERFFTKRFMEQRRYWMRLLGRPRGRQPSKKLTKHADQIDELHDQKRWSFPRIAKTVLPDDYAKDPKGTADAVRLNYRYRHLGIFTQDVEDIQNAEPQPEKPSEVSQVRRKATSAKPEA